MADPRRSKRLNAGGAAGAGPFRGRGRGRGRGGARGKGRAAVIDARANINQRQGRGGRRGRGVGVARLGGRISDARQILDSKQAVRSGGNRSRGAPNRSRISHPSAAAAVLNSLSLTTSSERNVFSQAVRAAMAPVLAPLLSRGATTVTTMAVRAPGSSGTGPCALRVANLAPSVNVNDLNDLFGGYTNFLGSEFEPGGIAVVRFSKRDAAEIAMEEYNNRELDGRTMVIQLDTSPTSAAHGAVSRLGPKPPSMS